MSGAKPFEFADLATAPLVVDAVYRGGTAGNIGDDPLARLLPVGNQGGFRFKGSPEKGTVKLAVLYTSGHNVDWPDRLDVRTGMFTYYGDNRSPGRELHDTQRGGNTLLRSTFARRRGAAEDRATVAPYFVFEKLGSGRDVVFRGVAAPGATLLGETDELVAVWRTTGGSRFQNYRACLTVLDVPVVERSWIEAVLAGDSLDKSCPKPWRRWVESGHYETLVAPPTRVIRKVDEQSPTTAVGRDILQAVRDHFAAKPTAFEACAVAIWRMLAPATGRCEVTRASKDGGRDAIGEYVLGPMADQVKIEFALEAKCYADKSSIGVRDMSRLISRLRHRHFGVFITTSHFNGAVYKEVREDEHPVVMICGADIVEALATQSGGNTVAGVQAWLAAEFPLC